MSDDSIGTIVKDVTHIKDSLDKIENSIEKMTEKLNDTIKDTTSQEGRIATNGKNITELWEHSNSTRGEIAELKASSITRMGLIGAMTMLIAGAALAIQFATSMESKTKTLIEAKR